MAIGLAAGFLEPLESTSISLIETGIEKLRRLFPDKSFDPALAEEFNRTSAWSSNVFAIFCVHYRDSSPTTRRSGVIVGRCRCRSRWIEAALVPRRGLLVRYEWETFLDPSWFALYTGFEFLPDNYDPLADFFVEAGAAATHLAGIS